MATLVVASNNPGKLHEFRKILAALPLSLVAASDAGVTVFPPEIGVTFAENARAKARYVTGMTGQPALGDDSGLVVDALNGAPGVFSARFGGAGLSDHDRCLLLLDKLKAVPHASRTARFIAALALSLPDGSVLESEGHLAGIIADQPRGTSGFGYDPLFIVGGTDRTLAEMQDDEKNAISHRARAFAALRPRLVAAQLAGGFIAPQ